MRVDITQRCGSKGLTSQVGREGGGGDVTGEWSLIACLLVLERGRQSAAKLAAD